MDVYRISNHITLRELAERLGVNRANLLKKIQREKVRTRLSPVMTRSGPQLARWIPVDYADKLVAYYEQAKERACHE
jgi:hypothetical protein